MASVTGRVSFLLAILVQMIDLSKSTTWSEWWSYDGISGPEFWGLVNPEWVICTKGKKQSPINIDPQHLLYDPNLRPLHVDKHRIHGLLVNTGLNVAVRFEDPSHHAVNMTHGPLSYKYRIHEIVFHFGSKDSRGSEHTVNQTAFPAEIQIIAYNADLYGNMTHSIISSSGLAVISVLVQIGEESNPEFNTIADSLKRVRYKGQNVTIKHLSVHGLIPPTHDYMTYEGSLTQPGCQETVTWIIINKPLYITKEQLSILRGTRRGTEEKPEHAMENNFRPTVKTNRRTIRTNINFPSPRKGCSMEKKMHYQANTWDR